MKHLSGLKRQGLITGWHAGEIEAGSEWDALLKKHLMQADIILLLISPDFIDSDNCYCIEMTLALERHQRHEAHVIPILLRPTEMTGLPFAILSPLPPDGKPVTGERRRNKDQAFAQIARAIRDLIEAMGERLPSEPAPAEQAGSAPTWWKVPYPRNAFFTGRISLLEQLRTAFLSSTAGVFVQTLNGLGGIGKTQIALEYAYRYCAAYLAIFWVAADPRGDLLADFVSIAQFLHLPEKDEPEQAQIVTAIQRWFQQHEGWLLIFDNVQDVAAVQAFLPFAGQGHVLITTRAQATGNIAVPREVESLEPQEGSEFLLRRVKLLSLETPLEQIENQQREAAAGITRLFAGHPLALDQAGAYLEETGQSLADYLVLYQQRQATLLSRRGEASMDHPESVMTTFSLALERVEKLRPDAVELLRFCAFLHPDALPEEILMAGAVHFAPAFQGLASDAFELSDALAALLKYSLVRRNPATKTISVHRLVQEVAKSGLDQGPQRHWAEVAVYTLSQEFPSGEPATWALCQRYLPHARACLELIVTWQMRFAEAAHLLNRVGHYFYKRAEYAEAQARYGQALELLATAEEPLLSAQIHSNLGLLYLVQAHYAPAEEYLRKALSVRERLLEPKHSDLAQSLNDLAGVYHNQGQLTQAEPFYQRALTIQEQTLGAEDPLTVRILGNLALLYYSQRKYSEAEALNQRVLAAREKLDAHSAETGQSLLNLAYVYLRQQRYAEAEPLFTRALAISEQIFGPDHPQTAAALNGFALLMHAQQKYDQAEPLLVRARTIWEQTSGPQHPRLVGVLKAQAEIALSREQYAEAEQLLRRAHQIQEQTPWLEYIDLAPDLKALAHIYEIQGKNAQAEPLYQLIVRIQQHVSGPDHPDTRAVQAEYAAFLLRMQKG